MQLHVHAGAAEMNSLHAKPKALLGATLTWDLDLSPSTQNAMPREPGNKPKRVYHLASGAGPSCGPSDGAVCGHLSRGQGTNAPHDFGSPVVRTYTAPLAACFSREWFLSGHDIQ
jgi:hypothetical protein